VKIDGWAMECRINAEDPFRGFLPSTGRLVKFQPPKETSDANGTTRVDTGVYDGGEISMFYDSMIAKLIVHAKDRTTAIARMRDALNAFVIRGISSNIPFQAALMQHPDFIPASSTPASFPSTTRRASMPRWCRTMIRPCWFRLRPTYIAPLPTVPPRLPANCRATSVWSAITGWWFASIHQATSIIR
jgi:acetyl/propionyl-CoA carboxylase alpha subunit